MKGESARVLQPTASFAHGFILIREGGKTACVRQAESLAIAEALLNGVGCEPAGVGGRGTLRRFPCGDSHGIIRVYQRGGMMRRFLRDQYLLRNRALRELEIHQFVFANALPTPEPLGACWERCGVWFRGAIATRELDAVTLLQHLDDSCEAQDAGSVSDLELLRSCGEAFRQMHDLGICHADLHVGNVLIARTPASSLRPPASGLCPDVYVIDFDKAFAANRLSSLQRARNLFRFRRSLEKHGLPPTLFEALCDGYGPTALPGWMSRVYRIKGRVSDLVARR
ncbi:MAG: hypothetical protein NTU83_04400 [Candidatus Hydrogenedentes bacterium]|nr:hypothetical protein [Candidatus Hydrogenedentota bacterium]